MSEAFVDKQLFKFLFFFSIKENFMAKWENKNAFKLPAFGSEFYLPSIKFAPQTVKSSWQLLSL